MKSKFIVAAPDQQLYDQTVTIQMKNDRVKILLDNKGTCFIEAKISDHYSQEHRLSAAKKIL
jgi:hypothetical protein